MQEITVSLPRLHTAQREIMRGAKRFNVIVAGRRFGKNILCHRRIIKAALPGKPCAWFAPTYRMLSEDWRELIDRLHPVIQRKDSSEHRIELIGGGSIDMWSLDNPDSARGRKYAHAIINEAAMVNGLAETWAKVIRPTLMDYQGGCDFPSTPRGLNDYFRLWQDAENTPDWARFHYRTDQNPTIPASEVAAFRASQPANVVQQELDAEFLEDGAYFQGVAEAAIIDHEDEPEQHAGHYKVGGLDWAMSNDYTVLTIACRDCNRVVAWDRFNQINFIYQRERITAFCKRWDVGGLMPERNSIGEPNIELLLAAGLPVLRGSDDKPGFMTTATSKPALIQKLATALEHDGLKVPRDYADELRSYQVEYSGNNLKFTAPDGQHDDRVISLALAWWAMSAPPLFVGRY